MEKTKQLIETLGKTGFEDSAHFSPNVFDNDVLSKVRMVIRDNLTRTKTIRNLEYTQSYPIKHKIEKYFKSIGVQLPVWNGLLIYAMYLEGYKVRRVGTTSLNAYFNVSTVSVRKLMAKSGCDNLTTKHLRK